MTERRKRSKKPSGTRAERLLEAATFFTYECLGKHVPADLRAAGMMIEAHHDHFAQGTEDVVWLPVVGERGWVVLTKDKAIRRKPWEMNKVIVAGVRLFTLPNGNMNGGEMTLAFLNGRHKMGRVLHRCPFPFVAVVTATEVTVVRGLPGDEGI